MNERASVITIGGEEYELLLTTAATKEISKKYGGLENLGNGLMQNEKFEDAIDEILELICILANGPVRIHNLRNEDKKQELTVEYLSLFTTPSDIAEFKDAIMDAMVKGTKRDIESEEVKNMEAV